MAKLQVAYTYMFSASSGRQTGMCVQADTQSATRSHAESYVESSPACSGQTWPARPPGCPEHKGAGLRPPHHRSRSPLPPPHPLHHRLHHRRLERPGVAHGGGPSCAAAAYAPHHHPHRLREAAQHVMRVASGICMPGRCMHSLCIIPSLRQAHVPCGCAAVPLGSAGSTVLKRQNKAQATQEYSCEHEGMCQPRSALHLRACCAGFHAGQMQGSDQGCGGCAAARPRTPLSGSSPGCSCLHPGSRLTQPAQMRKLSLRLPSQVPPCGHRG